MNKKITQMDARTKRRLRRAEIREKILNKEEFKKRSPKEAWEWWRKTNVKMCKDYCEKATKEMQQAEDVKKVIEHCYQNTPNLVDIKLINHHLKEKNLLIMSIQEVKENEEKKKEIEIYRSNILNARRMIEEMEKNIEIKYTLPLAKTMMAHLDRVHKILGYTIWPNPIAQHVFKQTDV